MRRAGPCRRDCWDRVAWHEEDAVRSRLGPVPTGTPASLSKVIAAKLPTRSLPANTPLYAAVSDALQMVTTNLYRLRGEGIDLGNFGQRPFPTPDALSRALVTVSIGFAGWVF